MNTASDFADYVRRRRRALDLTRTELAARVGCSPDTIKKIELGERRPSKELAILLAQHLAIGEAERPLFVAMARGQAAPDPVAYYDRLIRSTAPIMGTSGLGLARIRAEAGLDVDCTVEGREVSIVVQTTMRGDR